MKYVTGTKMEYSKLDLEEFEEYIEGYEQDLERKERNISKQPILMGLKMFGFLDEKGENIYAGHDIIYGSDWLDVRAKITEYDIELLVTNGWFIEEGCWSHFV